MQGEEKGGETVANSAWGKKNVGCKKNRTGGKKKLAKRTSEEKRNPKAMTNLPQEKKKKGRNDPKGGLKEKGDWGGSKTLSRVQNRGGVPPRAETDRETKGAPVSKGEKKKSLQLHGPSRTGEKKNHSFRDEKAEKS